MNLGDELDPFDFLSRHPLPVIGNYDTEKVLKAAIRIREETSQAGVRQKLSQTIRKGNWESSKRDADLTPFYQVKEELNIPRHDFSHGKNHFTSKPTAENH